MAAHPSPPWPESPSASRAQGQSLWFGQEPVRDLRLQQPFPDLREHRRNRHRIVARARRTSGKAGLVEFLYRERAEREPPQAGDGGRSRLDYGNFERDSAITTVARSLLEARCWKRAP
jgi:hypothetical protein